MKISNSLYMKVFSCFFSDDILMLIFQIFKLYSGLKSFIWTPRTWPGAGPGAVKEREEGLFEKGVSKS